MSDHLAKATLPNTLRPFLPALIAVLLVLVTVIPAMAAPQLDPETPANPAATITYDVFQLAPARTPYNAFACDSDGAVFYGAETKNVAPGYLGRVTPAGQMTEWAYGWAPVSIQKDSKGRIWTADLEGSEIARLVPATNRLTTWDTGYTLLHGISYHDSIVWTISRHGFVLRFRPGAGELRVFAVPGGAPLKHSLMDSQGRFWIAGGDLAGVGAAIYQFDKATRKFTRYQLPAGFNPFDIREAADGSIWFSNFSMKGRVTSSEAIARLDPATSQWTSYGSYPHPNRSTSLDWLGDQVIGANILGDEFFMLDPSTGGKTVTLTKTVSQGSLREVKTLAPLNRTVTPIVSALPRATSQTAGATATPYTTFTVPNPVQAYSLFGVRVCGSHVWMSGLLADQLYHFVR